MFGNAHRGTRIATDRVGWLPATTRLGAVLLGLSAALGCAAGSITPSFDGGLEQDTSAEPIPAGPVVVSVAERTLYEQVMAYRATRGLPAIPLSVSLTRVAQVHAADSEASGPPGNGACNMHSWSGNGAWNGCCYTSDHSNAACMWDKPRELTAYIGDGFEISAWTSGRMTADGALLQWQGSPGHNAVILNEGIWDQTWRAIGVGIVGSYAHIWFGAVEDPAGSP